LRPSASMLLSGILSIVLLNPACSRNSSKGSGPVLATINSQNIRLSEFENYFRKNWPLSGEENSVPPSLDIKLKFLNQLIEEKLILEEAERIGLDVNQVELAQRINEVRGDYTPDGFAKILIDNYIDYDEWKESLGNHILMEKTIRVAVKDRVDVSDQEIQDYYNNHLSGFERPRQLHLRQIVTESENKADEIRGRLIKGEEFTELAEKHSLAPEAKSGGDMGWVQKGQLLEEMEKAAFDLKPGSISKVIQTPFGYHILKLEEKRDAQTSPLEEVAEKIEGQIRTEKTERVYMEWINMMRERAFIQINYQLL
jgi:parvulin-like peptidyl-prolyl isomerase